MLQVIDQSGADLLLNPLVLMEREIVAGTTPIPVYAVVQQPGARVRAVLDWNDGTQPVVYAEQDSPLVIQANRNLSFGTYSILLTAFNTKCRVPDEIQITFPWQIAQLNPIGPSARNIFGPILPRDNGLPSADTWNFDTDSDLRVLQSNLKMLLITATGERVMLPTYGTKLRRIIFELNVATIETILQQEIAQAVALWEPRVTLQTILVQSDKNKRSIAIQATFLSRQNGQPVAVNLQFAQ
jgi:phage baseplate assembly protein W